MNWKKLIIRELITIAAAVLVFVGILSIIGNQDVREEDYYSTVSVIAIIIAVVIAALAAISYDDILDPFVVVAYVGAVASIVTITNDECAYVTSLILAVLAFGSSTTSTTTVVVTNNENIFFRKGKNRVFLILSYLLELVVITSIILIIVFLKNDLNILKLT